MFDGMDRSLNCPFLSHMFLLIDRFMTDGFQEREKA